MQTYIYAQTKQNTDTLAHNMHTERTQYAHNQHTHRTQNTEHRIQNTTIMQHTEYNKEQHIEQRTEQNTEHSTQHSTQNSAHNYRTYSFDLYHEYAYIKNNDTIELYTILQDKIQKTLIA